MTLAESVKASSAMFLLKFFNSSGWLTASIALSINRLLASASFTYNAAFLLTNAKAFLVWWSSATLGEGTRITGFCSKQNSEMEPAPARLMTKSDVLNLLPSHHRLR